jgi:hypothetical protein
VVTILICVHCGRNASVRWWKCCPEHNTAQGPDATCQSCVEKLHPNKLGDE